MSEQVEKPETGNQDGAGATPDHIKALNEEAKQHRLKAKALQEELDKIKAETEATKAAEAAKRGEFESLYTTAKGELDTIKPKLTEMESALQSVYEAEISGIPEEMQALIPDLPIQQRLTWVATAKKQGLFAGTPATPKTTSRTPGDNKDAAPKKPVDKIRAGLQKL